MAKFHHTLGNIHRDGPGHWNAHAVCSVCCSIGESGTEMTTIDTSYYVWNDATVEVRRGWPLPSMRFTIFAMGAIVAGAVMALLT